MPTSIDSEDLFFANKPAGISSHRPSEEHQGFVEWWQDQLNCELRICQRLDRETSGAMVFAKTKVAAQELTEKFSRREIKKQYLFVSPQKSKLKNWVVFDSETEGTLLQECPPQKEGVGYQAFTEFQRITEEGSLYLYKAFPKTGKTHQIRKHATHSKVPILGDETYGGETFVRMMLHCLSLQLDWKGKPVNWQCEESRLFKDLSLCENGQLAKWIHAFERREILFAEKFSNEECLRLFHSETQDLRGDKVGDAVVLGWWKSSSPTAEEEENISRLMQLLGFKKWIFQWRPGAQNQQSTEVILSQSLTEDDTWTFTENGVKYEASLNRGQNFGLFLDQRDRRLWVRKQAKDKKILNLFAFTGGFSVNGALSGAQKVETVDLFAKYLDWGKKNFLLNDLNPDDVKYIWRKMDVIEYFKFAQKKNLKFDIIVCDPPSFSRNKKTKKVFRVDKDFHGLIANCLQRLEPQGTLLFSTNFEKWTLEKWVEELEASIKEIGRTLGARVELEVSPSQWDYEWQKKDANLKSFFLHKA